MIASPWRVVAWLAFVATLATLNYAGRAAGAEPEEDALYQWGFAVSGLIAYTIVVLVILLIGIGTPYRVLLALRRPRTSFWRTVGLVAVALVGIFVASFLVELVLDPGEEQGLTPDEWRSDRAPQFVASFVAVAVFAPVAEELTYRGAGFSLLSTYGVPVAFVGTALAFGLGHGLLEALAPLVVFGLLAAWLRHETASVYPGIAFHAIFNGLALVAAVTVET